LSNILLLSLLAFLAGVVIAVITIALLMFWSDNDE